MLIFKLHIIWPIYSYPNCGNMWIQVTHHCLIPRMDQINFLCRLHKSLKSSYHINNVIKYLRIVCSIWYGIYYVSYIVYMLWSPFGNPIIIVAFKYMYPIHKNGKINLIYFFKLMFLNCFYLIFWCFLMNWPMIWQKSVPNRIDRAV